MKFAVDHHFVISHTHANAGKPCQDYAFSGIYGDLAFVIVADGCSGGQHTDIGARITALSAVNTVRQGIKNWEEIDRSQEKALVQAREAFGLDWMDMLATSGSVCLKPSGGWIHLRGDGVVAYAYSDGSVVLKNYSWKENVPLYPAYAQNNYQTFIERHGGDVTKMALSIIKAIYDPISGWGENQLSEISIADGIVGSIDIIGADEMKTLSCVAIFSDGIAQIENLDWKDAALELLAFKNTTGEFMKRRLIKFLKDKKRGLLLDDLSCAVVCIDNEEESSC